MTARAQPARSQRSLVPQIAVGLGLTMLICSLPWLIAGMLGLAPTDLLGAGHATGLRSLAAIAIAGCLIAALGSLKQEMEQQP